MQQTAAVRAALQNALDSGYVPKSEHLPLNVGQTTGSIGETRSFGETHATELSSIVTVTDNGHEASTPINPAALNNAPAPIPSTATHYNAPAAPPEAAHHYPSPSAGPPSSFTAPGATHTGNTYAPPVAPPSASAGSASSVPHGPTVAETGVPVTAGAEGPGPATGSLHPASDEVRDRPTVGYGVGINEQAPAYGGTAPLSIPTHESAEEEKRRLAASQQTATTAPAPYAPLGVPHEGHQGGLVASTSTRRPATHESAEDEKKRLEREERERILAPNERTNTRDDGTDPSGGAAPPAYND